MKRTVLAFLFILSSRAAFAQDAGCGLGSMIIQDNSKLMQILAATTNGTGGQTFAITSGTSNCKAQNFVLNQKAIQYFAEVNQADLSREMAQGKGEKLETLASLYGCNGAARLSFEQMTQSSYGAILPTPDTATTAMVQNLNQQFKSQPQLMTSCQSAL